MRQQVEHEDIQVGHYSEHKRAQCMDHSRLQISRRDYPIGTLSLRILLGSFFLENKKGIEGSTCVVAVLD